LEDPNPQWAAYIGQQLLGSALRPKFGVLRD
jgi:hypothetical protein